MFRTPACHFVLLAQIGNVFISSCEQRYRALFFFVEKQWRLFEISNLKV